MRKRIICPSCGSGEVKYNKKTKEFHCSYCQTDFNIKSVDDTDTKSIVSSHKNLVIAAGFCVLVLGGIIAGSLASDNRPQKYPAYHPTTTVTPTGTVTPTHAPVYDINDQSKDVWTRVLECLFQIPYEDITKEQLESIQFLGLYRDNSDNTVVVQIGFEDFFTYEGEKEDFEDTITTYELKYIGKDEFDQAFQSISKFSKITVLQTTCEVDQNVLNFFPDLKGLALERCENPYFLAKFPNLRQLYLKNAPVRDYLASLSNLESLTLVNCDLDQMATWMTEFKKLKILILKDCQETMPLNYDILASLPNLQEVSMIHCELNFEINGVLNIPNLKYLNLSDSEFYLNPKDVILPETLVKVDLDNITPRGYVYEMVDGERYRITKNNVPVDSIQKLLTPLEDN